MRVPLVWLDSQRRCSVNWYSDEADGDEGDCRSDSALERLRSISGDPLKPSVERVSRELRVRTDPDQVAPSRNFELPWSRAAQARSRARDLSVEARLDIFRDDLRAIRIANEVLNRAATMRAVEAAETAIFEIRTVGETARFAILNRTHLEMTRNFVL